jgi:hypothetical protein
MNSLAIGLLVFFLVASVVITALVYYLCLRKKDERVGYVNLDPEASVQRRAELLKKVPTVQHADDKVEACLQYLRMHSRRTLKEYLFGAGSRAEKSYYLVLCDGQEELLEMYVVDAVIQKRLVLGGDAGRAILAETLLALSRAHPGLLLVRAVDFIGSRGQVFIFRPWVPRGSLRDAVYEARDPKQSHLVKYPVERRRREGKVSGLSAKEVASFGRELLETLCFLQQLKYPLQGLVKLANVVVDQGVAKWTDYEVPLLAVAPPQPAPEDPVLAFAEMVFEMACGYPRRNGEQAPAAGLAPQVKEFLDRAFGAATRAPGLDELLKDPLFALAKVPSAFSAASAAAKPAAVFSQRSMDMLQVVRRSLRKSRDRDRDRDSVSASGRRGRRSSTVDTRDDNHHSRAGSAAAPEDV